MEFLLKKICYFLIYYKLYRLALELLRFTNYLSPLKDTENIKLYFDFLYYYKHELQHDRLAIRYLQDRNLHILEKYSKKDLIVYGPYITNSIGHICCAVELVYNNRLQRGSKKFLFLVNESTCPAIDLIKSLADFFSEVHIRIITEQSRQPFLLEDFLLIQYPLAPDSWIEFNQFRKSFYRKALDCFGGNTSPLEVFLSSKECLDPPPPGLETGIISVHFRHTPDQSLRNALMEDARNVLGGLRALSNIVIVVHGPWQRPLSDPSRLIYGADEFKRNHSLSDVEIFARSKAIIGSPSGPINLGWLFNKPSVTIGLFPICHHLPGPDKFFVPRGFFSRRLGRPVSSAELHQCEGEIDFHQKYQPVALPLDRDHLQSSLQELLRVIGVAQDSIQHQSSQ